MDPDRSARRRRGIPGLVAESSVSRSDSGGPTAIGRNSPVDPPRTDRLGAGGRTRRRGTTRTCRTTSGCCPPPAGSTTTFIADPTAPRPDSDRGPRRQRARETAVGQALALLGRGDSGRGGSEPTAGPARSTRHYDGHHDTRRGPRAHARGAAPPPAAAGLAAPGTAPRRRAVRSAGFTTRRPTGGRARPCLSRAPRRGDARAHGAGRLRG